MREHWNSYIDTLNKTVEERVFGDPKVDSPLLEAEGLRFLTRVSAAAALAEMEVHDPAYPQFWKAVSAWMTYGSANPDALYLCAYLHGDYSYRIFGRRGTAHVLDMEVWHGDQADMVTNRNLGGLCDAQDGPHDFEFGPNGEFEIFLSRERREGNWIQTPPGLGYVVVRQLFRDWENEDGADVYIEREGAQYPPPSVSEQELTDNLRLAGEFVLRDCNLYAKGVAAHYDMPVNSFRFQPMTLGQQDRGEGTGVAGQLDSTDHYYYRHFRMGQGNYRCEEDEAVILEMPAPRTVHWNYYLTSHYSEGLAWNLRQSSINTSQAVVDDDEILRLVIAHRDPGIPNWLDTADHHIGLVTARYFRPDGVDNPEFRVVKLDDLRSELPASTPTVTPEQRSDALRRRMHSVRRRLCDF